MTVLGDHYGEEITSADLATSVGAHEALVRKVLSRLVKAGLVKTSRGRNGFSSLAKPAKKISLLEIYKAVDPPPVFSIHDYPKTKKCRISCSHKEVLKDVLKETQLDFESSLENKMLSDMVEKARQYR
jgi:Rrf2 family protein